jgi:hypothetical protein
MVFFWPFKTGYDDTFRVATEKPPSIYDQVGAIPERNFEQEYDMYRSRKWRKGLLQGLIPAMSVGTLLGLMWGVYESRRGLIRYANRFRIVFHQTVVVAGLSGVVATTHHMLVVATKYREGRWQPLCAGTVGGVIYATLVSGSVSPAGALAGFIIGLLYSGACIFMAWYDHRHTVSFLGTQQQRDTPIHRIAPELQPLYRSWLYDHRPIEDLSDLQRRALTQLREQKDLRLDAQAYREAMKLQPVWDMIQFPEWWPLKMSEKDELLEQRLRDDQFERRKREMTDENSNGQYLLAHIARTEQGRSASGEKLW